ncbi:ATP-binding cassette domain-containing protein [Microbacterium sp. MEC084]|uniref:ABC transporter ATP-binding protein n=1 Tax=Microbacterium sp. MEC084 TaxID=1963027 RepID=UPI00106F7DB0|nr:ABC transporter ATP-binding protein [Microbacterium sp. MEC084]MCD1268028.1 ATP-binding cassette domain-containing protein [Microbacterium sp. MEC084]
MTTDQLTPTRRPAPPADVRVESLRVGYGAAPIVDGIDLAVPTGAVSAIVGPNGCGKSTLLKTMARVLSPDAGRVLLDGESVHRMSTRRVARLLGLLPQSSAVPEQLTVRDLVERGRFPHRGMFTAWTADDRTAVSDALEATGMTELADRPVDELSGGQRQRAWIAMVLAQQTPILLLDEPTTYLDLAHRLEILRLLRTLNRERGVTVVMVLHDLVEACRYSDHLIAIRDGAIYASGSPAEVITPETVSAVFGVDCVTIPDPVSGMPIVVPTEPELAESDTSS